MFCTKIYGNKIFSVSLPYTVYEHRGWNKRKSVLTCHSTSNQAMEKDKDKIMYNVST